MHSSETVGDCILNQVPSSEYEFRVPNSETRIPISEFPDCEGAVFWKMKHVEPLMPIIVLRNIGAMPIQIVTAGCWRMLMTNSMRWLMTDLTTAMTNAMLRVPKSGVRDCLGFVLKHNSCWATGPNKHTRKENHRDRSPRAILNRLGLKF